MRRWLVAAVLAGCATSCATEELALAPITQQRVELFDLPQQSLIPVDLLIVMDDSAAITPYEAELPAAFRLFDETQYWRLDLHVGVISADLGDAAPGCTPTGLDGRLVHKGVAPGTYLALHRNPIGPPTQNFAGALPDVLAQLAPLGHAGCARQQPLAAILRALDGQPANTGFRRPGAHLALVVIAASDDASTASVDELATALHALAAPGDPGLVYLSILAPVGSARLDEIVARFPNRNTRLPLEDLRLDEALPVFEPFGPPYGGNPCVDGELIDRDDATPDLQPDCAFSEVLVTPHGRVELGPIPACAPASTGVFPCWRIAPDPRNCPFATGLMIAIERESFPQPGIHVVGQCVTRATPDL